MTELDSYPSILRSKNGDCFLMVRVDDLLIVGSRDAVMKQLVPSLQSKYAISIEVMSKPGDEVTFLKRTHELLEDGRMVFRVHDKHLDQLSCANSCAFPKGFRARRPQVTARWRFQTSLQSSIPMMLRCTALAWGFFCTCQLTCHGAIM